MYVTMMMTDQIPLDLAPPPLLNGEVPLMPHMVNGDAAQQVNKTCTPVACIKLSVQMRLSTFLWHHTNASTRCTQEYTSNSHAGTSLCCHFITWAVATGNEQLLQGICHTTGTRLKHRRIRAPYSCIIQS